MFNINANIGSQRFGLSSLSKDMGLGGERQREQGAVVVQAVPARASEPDDAVAHAHVLAAEQRRAAESLLLEARALEKQLLDESAEAAKARARSSELAGALSHAMAAEQEARERTAAATERHASASTQRRQIETVLAASRRATEAATAEIAELKRRLEDVLKVATDASDLLHAQERRAAEATAAATGAEEELSQATAQLAVRQTEREAAERAAASMA